MDKYLTEKKYWKKRAKDYDKLQWAKREDYIKSFLEVCDPQKEDTVLDLGTGTGTIAHAISPQVKDVIGVDISEDMLSEAQKHNRSTNIQFLRGDIRDLPFLDNSFTKVTARMVFHHLIRGLKKAVKEVYRVLKPGGIFCLSEGVPPDRCVEKFYKEVFRLKEKRLTFFPEDLKEMIHIGGFKDVNFKEYTMKHCSIRNWLSNDTSISNDAKKEIYKMHLGLHEDGKKTYNMHITSKDCFIDMKFIIISGRK
jgi:ubiquinone/menaquinone biosynthesis C-methylase UbiE